tara:strand:- start:176 stop:748 length:573 start_codon:yes stop_codon:yes gene_type:complete
MREIAARYPVTYRRVGEKIEALGFDLSVESTPKETYRMMTAILAAMPPHVVPYGSMGDDKTWAEIDWCEFMSDLSADASTDAPNEAQALQARVFPNWKPDEVRIVSLTYVVDDSVRYDRKIECCKTLAASLDEAVERAKDKYGPGHLNAWGTHRLPLTGWLLGGGELIPGRHDKDHEEDLFRMAEGPDII